MSEFYGINFAKIDSEFGNMLLSSHMCPHCPTYHAPHNLPDHFDNHFERGGTKDGTDYFPCIQDARCIWEMVSFDTLFALWVHVELCHRTDNKAVCNNPPCFRKCFENYMMYWIHMQLYHSGMFAL